MYFFNLVESACFEKTIVRNYSASYGMGWATSKALTQTPNVVDSLEISRRAESETCRTFEKSTFWWNYAEKKFGAMDRRKNDVPTEMFSQGLKKPLAREREKPL